MQTDTTNGHDEIDRPLIDPESLFGREAIDSEQILRAQDQSHFDTREEVAGFAIVGITNDTGEVLLTSSSDGEWWRLPYARVEQDEDYCVAAAEATGEQFTVDIEIDRVVHVRRFDAVLEDSPAAALADRSAVRDELADLGGFNTSFDVLLEATLAEHAENPPTLVDVGSDSTAEWFGSVPDGAPGGLPGEDLRRFIG